MKNIIILIILCFQLVFGSDIRILFNNSDNGHINGCRCPSNPKSGIVKRAVFIRKYMTDHSGDCLLLSAGDSFAIYPNEHKARQVAAALSTLPYDVISIGDQEFVNGFDFMEKHMSSLPLMSANLTYDNNGKKSFPGHIIKKVAGHKVGIIAVTGRDTFKYFRPKERLSNISISDEAEAVNAAIAKIKDSTDVIIVVSHMGIEGDKKLAAAVKDVDVIIGGHSQYLTSKPEIVNDVIILQAGKNANFQGELILQMKSGRIDDHSCTFHFFRYHNPSKPISEKVIIGNQPFEEYTYQIHDHPADDEEVKKALTDLTRKLQQERAGK